MAAVMEVPMAGISYDPKIDAFMEQVKQPLITRLDDSIEIGDMLLKLSDGLEHREQLKDVLIKEMDELRPRATNTAKLTLDLVTGNKTD